ncbi:MAG: prevent-host-death protein [Planctomycetes bacterium]|nr:prevent-host-death protein [Planctomycetota bacterium]
MRAVGIKVLKNHLSEYVRLAERGETVLVVDRDRVVAELTPPREGRSPFLADARLAQAVREGWVTPPALVGAGPPPRLPVAPLKRILRELEGDREDR